MKNVLRNIKGFSMIEVLVVVLIIGVLAAVMVPGYEKSSEKSNVAEATIGLRAIETAAREKFMVNRALFETSSLADIGVVLTNGEMDSDGQWVTKNWTFGISGDSTKWTAFANRNTGDYRLTSAISPNSRNSGLITGHRCSTKKTSIGRYVCKYIESNGWTYKDS